MRFRENVNEMIIEETPGCLWVFGLFFAIIGGLFVYMSLGGASNWSEVPAWQNLLGFVVGSIGVLAGWFIIIRAPVTRIVIDRMNDKVIYKTRGLTGTNIRVFAFADLRKFFVLEDTDSDGDPIWSLALELRNGEKIQISSLASPDETFKQNFVNRANEAIRWLPRSVVDTPQIDTNTEND